MLGQGSSLQILDWHKLATLAKPITHILLLIDFLEMQIHTHLFLDNATQTSKRDDIAIHPHVFSVRRSKRTKILQYELAN